MANCFQPWIDNFETCSSVLGGLQIPGVQTPENAESRAIICSKPECQKLFTVFRELIDVKCDRALREVKRFPNGMFQLAYCPSTPVPGPGPMPNTTAPSPTNQPTTPASLTPTPTTKKPAPTPMSTVAVPASTMNASSEEETSLPVVTTLLPISATAGIATEAPLIAPTTAPTLVQATAKGGTTGTTVAAVTVGGLAAIVVLVLLVFGFRRWRTDKAESSVAQRTNEGFVPH